MMAGKGRTVCLVPAYNEAERIGAVLSVLIRCGLIDEVVVVDDGSTDDTAAVARATGARVIVLPENLGKGAALQAGIDQTQADAYLFIDADLISLAEGHLKALLSPLSEDAQAAMVVGIAQEGRVRVDLAQRFFPVLNGQRAFSADFLKTLPDLSEYGWGVEVIISAWARAQGVRVAVVRLSGLSQVMKEEKDGLVKGIRLRARMYTQILSAVIRSRILIRIARQMLRNRQRPGKEDRLSKEEQV